MTSTYGSVQFDATLFKIDTSRTQSGDGIHVVTHKEYGASTFARYFAHLT